MAKKKSDDKTIAILSYVLIGIIWYFVDEKVQNKFNKFHVKQALNLLVINILGSFVISMLMFISGMVSLVFSVLILILWIVGLVNAIKGETKEIPIIGSLADKYLTF